MFPYSKPGPLLVQATAPTGFAVSKDDVKANARIDHADHDALIDRLIKSATNYIEDQTGRKLISQNWKYFMDRSPSSRLIALPLAPVQSLEEISYIDVAGIKQTAATAGFNLYASTDDAWIEPIAGTSWPATQCRPDALSITFKAGYGDTAAAIPEALRQAIILLVCHWLANPEASTMGAVSKETDFSVSALLEPFHIGWMA